MPEHTWETAAPVSITDFGAVADGVSVCTDAINDAITHAVEHGAEKVVVPPGEFITGTVRLRSGLTFEIMPGAVLKASPNIEDFPVRGLGEGEIGHQDHSRRTFLFAEDCENLTLCGGGTIDGNNEVYANPPKEKRGPNHQWFGYRKNSYQPTLQFVGCRNVRLVDITIQHGVRWNIHLQMCDRVWVERVCILNDPYAGNSDGLDIDACHDVHISNCKIDTGDDAIVLKTLYNTRSCERITVTNCVLKSTCAAFKIGTESFHDFRNITFSNSVVHQSPRFFEALTFDGGMIEDISVSGIVGDTNSGVTMCRPFHLDASRRRSGYAPLGDRGDSYQPGEIRRVSISHCSVVTDGRILMTGADGALLRQICLRDIHIHMPWIEDPVAVKDKSDGMQSSNASPEARLARSVIVAKDIRGLIIDGVTVTYTDGPVGENYRPKIEKRELVRDPRVDFEPMPSFSVFWGKSVKGGSVDLCGARPFREAPAVVLDACDVRVME